MVYATTNTQKPTNDQRKIGRCLMEVVRVVDELVMMLCAQRLSLDGQHVCTAIPDFLWVDDSIRSRKLFH